MAKEKYLCPCMRVREEDVIRALRGGAGGFKQVKKATGAGAKCGKCEEEVRRFIKVQLRDGVPQARETKAENPSKQSKKKKMGKPGKLHGLGLRGIVLDCREPLVLAGFYRQLMGAKAAVKGDERFAEYELEGGALLGFSRNEGYLPPAWPPHEGRMQMQAHLDIDVRKREDMARAVERALALGARLAEPQYGGEAFTTLLDPEGHPFCLVPRA